MALLFCAIYRVRQKVGQVSLGSVATYARCGGIINNEYAVNLQRNLLVKKWTHFFGLPCMFAVLFIKNSNNHKSCAGDYKRVYMPILYTMA